MKKLQRIIVGSITLGLSLIPFLFWGNLYTLGGDDSKLYYLFPFEYFKNFTLSIISTNQLGVIGSYFPESYISGFALFLFVMKNVFFFLNTQLLLFGLNIGLSFFCFYLLLGIWMKNITWENFWSKILAALAYSLSIFTVYSMWSSQLFGMYLLSVYPFVLYLFFRSILEKKIYLAVIGAVIFSVLSALLLSLPWLIALVIATIPLGLHVFFQKKVRTIFTFFLFAVLIFFLNFYWLFHFIYAPYSSDSRASNGLVSTVASVENRKANEYLITQVSEHNSVFYPLLDLFHKNIQIDFGWASYKIYKNWNLELLYLNLLFPLIIVSAGFIAVQRTKEDHRLFFVSIFAWLLTTYFFTVHMGSWGTPLFLWFNEKIPGFVMFRNMYDKFGPAMAFTFAFVIAWSVKMLLDHKSNFKFKFALIGLLLFAITLNAKPFIFDEYHQDPVWTTQNTYGKIANLNNDFYDLTRYLKNMNSSDRFLWFPLNNANYVLIQDQSLANHYYVGVSPLQFLSNKSDFNGRISFEPTFANELMNDIVTKKYATASGLLRQMDVKYVIVNNNISPDLRNSYLFTMNGPGDLYRAQDESFKTIILGRKIQDFGQRYSLYEVNPTYQIQKIYMTDTYESFPKDFSSVTYEQVHNYQYHVNISHLNKTEKLVFLDPYHKQWDLLWWGSHQSFFQGSHDTPFQYANGWELNPDAIKSHFSPQNYKVNPDGSLDLDLEIYFRPQSFFTAGLAVSATAGILVVLYLIGTAVYILRKSARKQL